MEDKLILLKRQHPTEYEIHRFEIRQTKNLILTTNDLEFAQRIVDSYNKSYLKRNDEQAPLDWIKNER